jgi:hypothetical protein
MRLPNFGYHLARWHGRMVRGLYRFLLPWIARRRIDPPRDIALDVFAYSNDDNVPEQVASIRSFLKYAGRPRRYVVVSDGSHSGRNIALLETIDRSVSVERRAPEPPVATDEFRRYLDEHPTGKQLDLIMSLPRDLPALYADSDVLFFSGATDLLRLLEKKHDAPALYLADCQFAGDYRLLHAPEEKNEPANTGLLLLFQRLDWSLSIKRFGELEGAPTFFTNQTMTHLTMHQNGARALDPARYVLRLDDQFVFRDRYAADALALRHYVNPVRHKFWTSLS